METDSPKELSPAIQNHYKSPIQSQQKQIIYPNERWRVKRNTNDDFDADMGIK